MSVEGQSPPCSVKTFVRSVVKEPGRISNEQSGRVHLSTLFSSGIIQLQRFRLRKLCRASRLSWIS
jgi:hypothetical protein